MLGLGDLGSSLPVSFDIAFANHDSLYSGDWKHVRDYASWNKKMRDAIRNRNEAERDKLLEHAYCFADKTRLDKFERCPVWALDSYLTNNWDRMNAKQFKDMGADFVSARAECQVRVRTAIRSRARGIPTT